MGAADADALLSNVSSDDEMLASLGPMVGLARVARGEMGREAYLEQWGHRGALETEASAPGPVEDPGWLDQQLAAFAESPMDVESTAGSAARRIRCCLGAVPGAISSQGQIGAAAPGKGCRGGPDARSGPLRERADHLGGPHLGSPCRRSDGIGDGAFFLSIDELLDLLAGKDGPAAYIPARQQTYERYKALPPFPLLIRGRFDPFQWAADPDRRTDVFDSHGLLPTLRLKALRENVILGMPGSAGQVEGVVRRLDRPEDGDELQPGEILVASQTNIGWTLFFPRAAAIVTDVGAPLSHAAIVARELGIPAVVNCGDATTRLRTGDRVRVDGGQGTVEILETEGFDGG